MSSFSPDSKNYSVNRADANQNADEDSVKLLGYTPKGKTQPGQNGNAHTGTHCFFNQMLLLHHAYFN